jgi:hypothetical protein
MNRPSAQPLGAAAKEKTTMWMRTCPWCLAQGIVTMLYKKFITETVPCPAPQCGWSWQGDPEGMPASQGRPTRA